MLALILSLAVASQQPTPVVSEAPPEAAPQSPAPLDSPREVRALCEALAPSGRIAPSKENAVDRGRAELAHDTRRQAALDGRYQVAIRSERLRFADYDADERELSLSERSFLATAGDSLQIWATHDVGLPVTVDVASAERIMQATARRALVLRLIFTLPDDEDGLSCGHASGSNRYSLGVEPFRWEYVEGNEV
ncbi:MAG TPA: hypothetical protein VMK12_04120, partial [Anaeromyxobacteraceae bacterium]|nr:hypothetical protein [Anaeromyxobacteraceae bacterium]